MARFIRYALATVCFAASVGCLALWVRNCRDPDAMASIEVSIPAARTLLINVEIGIATIGIVPGFTDMPVGWKFWRAEGYSRVVKPLKRQFGMTHRGAVYCPLWYPALIFALAGVGALRLGRRFTVRSALAATTVIAALVAMPIVL